MGHLWLVYSKFLGSSCFGRQWPSIHVLQWVWLVERGNTWDYLFWFPLGSTSLKTHRLVYLPCWKNICLILLKTSQIKWMESLFRRPYRTPVKWRYFSKVLYSLRWVSWEHFEFLFRDILFQLVKDTYFTQTTLDVIPIFFDNE